MLALAVLFDLAIGEPPNRWHPVAWLGCLIAAGRRLAPQGPPAALLLCGGILTAAVIVIAAGAALLVEWGLRAAPEPLQVIVEAWLLKCSFSLRALFMAVELIRGHLIAGDLAGARLQVALHLVSRPTGDLDEGGVASAAVESLAENLTDAWVAPLLFFVIGGLAGSWAYRAVNTADAMIGYRQGALLYLGRVAARLDDLSSFVPARIAALCLILGAWLAGQSAAGAWRLMRRDAASTESPNAGQTMAAMAGALGVTLEKQAHYRLGEGPLPGPATMDRAMTIARHAAAVWLALAFLFWGVGWAAS
ncbi:MAG TPA: adenosylcobinamide-phosphate synthase CbiB [Methylomirabilota bacterium]|jgi:adenosylcobinamide-phosphate synthase|nr:adenosylcobinamide-phosphate synthase CbiB [Methylomirabilota bacterium]